MTISFLEACNGVQRKVTLSYPATCGRCQGRKGEPGSGLRSCHRCKGSGHVSPSCPIVRTYSMYIHFRGLDKLDLYIIYGDEFHLRGILPQPSGNIIDVPLTISLIIITL